MIEKLLPILDVVANIPTVHSQADGEYTLMYYLKGNGRENFALQDKKTDGPLGMTADDLSKFDKVLRNLADGAEKARLKIEFEKIPDVYIDNSIWIVDVIDNGNNGSKERFFFKETDNTFKTIQEDDIQHTHLKDLHLKRICSRINVLLLDKLDSSVSKIIFKALPNECEISVHSSAGQEVSTVTEGELYDAGRELFDYLNCTEVCEMELTAEDTGNDVFNLNWKTNVTL